MICHLFCDGLCDYLTQFLSPHPLMKPSMPSPAASGHEDTTAVTARQPPYAPGESPLSPLHSLFNDVIVH